MDMREQGMMVMMADQENRSRYRPLHELGRVPARMANALKGGLRLSMRVAGDSLLGQHTARQVRGAEHP